MNVLIRWAIEATASRISNAAEEGEDQNLTISSIAVGALLTLGAFFYLYSSGGSFIERSTPPGNSNAFGVDRVNTQVNADAVRRLNEAGILTDENFYALIANQGEDSESIAADIRRLDAVLRCGAQINAREL